MSDVIKKEDLRFIPKTPNNPYILKTTTLNANVVPKHSELILLDKSNSLNKQLETEQKAIRKSQQYEKGLRIGRIKYISHSIWFGVGTGVLLAIVPPVAIITLIALLVSTKRRLNDLNKSGIGSFLILIPIVGFIFGLYLYFAKGDEGINDYGEPPTLSALDIVFFILSLLAPFAVIAIVFVVVMSGASF